MSRLAIEIMHADGHWTYLEVPEAVQVIAYADESIQFAVEPLARLKTERKADGNDDQI